MKGILSISDGRKKSNMKCGANAKLARNDV